MFFSNDDELEIKIGNFELEIDKDGIELEIETEHGELEIEWNKDDQIEIELDED